MMQMGNVSLTLASHGLHRMVMCDEHVSCVMYSPVSLSKRTYELFGALQAYPTWHIAHKCKYKLEATHAGCGQAAWSGSQSRTRACHVLTCRNVSVSHAVCPSHLMCATRTTSCPWSHADDERELYTGVFHDGHLIQTSRILYNTSIRKSTQSVRSHHYADLRERFHGHIITTYQQASRHRHGRSHSQPARHR